jgi:predicted dehydrogenase
VAYANLPMFLASPEVQVVAVCDVDRWRAEQARQRVEAAYAQAAPSGTYRGCAVYEDFRDVLARPDIDAVMISTPDHWHAAMAVAAARAGKDVALEKPISLSVAEGRAITNAMAQHGRVFRTDTEVRSQP